METKINIAFTEAEVNELVGLLGTIPSGQLYNGKPAGFIYANLLIKAQEAAQYKPAVREIIEDKNEKKEIE